MGFLIVSLSFGFVALLLFLLTIYIYLRIAIAVGTGKDLPEWIYFIGQMLKGRATRKIPLDDVTDSTALKEDRKSTRLNSSHANISYAVFCLKKKTPLHRQSLFIAPPLTMPLLPP